MRYMVRRLFQSYPSKSYTLRTNVSYREAFDLKEHPTDSKEKRRYLTKRFGPWFDVVCEQPE